MYFFFIRKFPWCMGCDGVASASGVPASGLNLCKDLSSFLRLGDKYHTKPGEANKYTQECKFE